eukprot:TRINITY_DN6791_c0_g1_i1.p1 TRINITY_DN6791_c0_g1~~TRINITY_DN6791_c0_g1_i1.p1  ORF type:complete len:128 (+),score=31.31 TRINITY_DN6791_c0_g1_i1:60-386(+)
MCIRDRVSTQSTWEGPATASGSGSGKGLRWNPLVIGNEGAGKPTPQSDKEHIGATSATSSGKPGALKDQISVEKLKYFPYVKPAPRVSRANEFIPVLPLVLIRSKSTK